MKNTQILISRDDVHKSCFELLRSDVFKSSYNEGGLIYQWIDAYAGLPRIICDYSDYDLERSHFYPYMGVLPKRDYGPLAALSDLYYFHEQGHSIVAGFQENQPFSLWVNRLTLEEARTSVQSELAIYFHLPDLRETVFQDREIWADRFLKDEVKIYEGKEFRLPRSLNPGCSNWALFSTDPELFTLFAMERRTSIMQSLDPSRLDPQEFLIHGYAANNYKWADIWRPVRDKVERAMLILARGSDVDREFAINAHLRFLLEEKDGNVCPFEPEARAFYQVMEDFKTAQNIQQMDKETG